MNSTTPRVFIAATRQNDGKTTTSLGLLAAIQKYYPRVGYIKPVGQRFVEIDEVKIDEDTVLMDRVYRLNCPLVDMSPIAVEPDFTRKYLQTSNNDALVKKIHKAFDRVAWEKDFVLCEGSGHAGVGSVFDLSNAQVASILKAKVIIVTQGGIGKPVDEVSLNKALFDKEGVEIVGVIVNKVRIDKVDTTTDFVRRGLKRKGLELLGVIPYRPTLSCPSVAAIEQELGAQLLNNQRESFYLVDEVVIAAMSVHNINKHLGHGVLLIVPADRDDIIEAVAATLIGSRTKGLAGMILTDVARPDESLMKLVRQLPFPVLCVNKDSYGVASIVHDMIVKTRPDETEKISLIRDLIAEYVDVARIIESVRS